MPTTYSNIAVIGNNSMLFKAQPAQKKPRQQGDCQGFQKHPTLKSRVGGWITQGGE
jgi:hypothetical protein